MNARAIRLLGSLLALASLTISYGTDAQDAAGAPVGLQVQNFKVAEIATDHLRVSVRVLVRTRERARILNFSMAHCSLNGAPVFLNSWDQPIELPAKEFVQLPGELTALVFYRDLDSPDSLEKLLSDGSVTLEGDASLTIQLSLPQKIAVMSRNATTVVPLHTTIPVDIPGGDLGRNAGLVVLHAARPLFGAARKASADVGISRPDPWQEENQRKYRGALLYVISHYQLRSKNGAVAYYTYRGSGFRISLAHFVLLREAMEPWRFNPECVAKMRGGGAHLVDGSADIEVYFAGDVLDGNRHGLSLRRGDFRLVSEGKEDRKRVMVPSTQGFRKSTLEVRGSGGNLAVFAFTSPRGLEASPELAHDTDALDSMTVVRFQTPKPAQPLEVESIAIRAHRNGDQLELDDPVDPRTFGSPAIVPSGILAVVQDEHSAALVHDSLRTAGYGLNN